MQMVEIKNICKSFGEVRAVDHVSLEVQEGEMLCLLGPSGCGKTTLLRLLSGFLEPDEGIIIMNGKDVTNLPPEKRPTSLVFQNYALFPHLNVFENIAFGLRVQKLPMKEIRKRVNQMLEIVGLEGKGERAIMQLSGGQQQRVALGRALAMQPQVLLLDEPLSNLDAKLRTETRAQIRQIQRRVGITSIFVTHDQEEALTMADRIAVMRNGVIEQISTPRNIYHNPKNKFIANFIGKSNFLSGKYDFTRNCFVLDDGQEIIANAPQQRGENNSFVLRPEYIALTTDLSSIPYGYNKLKGIVEEVVFLGELTSYKVRISHHVSLSVQTYGYVQSHKLDDQVYVYWKQSSGQVL
jgi:spermidine/putrescine ABC transporter ATP-binding subunit